MNKYCLRIVFQILVIDYFCTYVTVVKNKEFTDFKCHVVIFFSLYRIIAHNYYSMK